MLLPGLREFRVPFTVGAMWLGALAIVGVTYPGLTENHGFYEIKMGYLKLPSAIQLGIITGIAYGLGLISHRIASDIAVPFGRRFRSRTSKLADNTLRRKLREWILGTLYPPLVGVDPLYSRILGRTFHSNESESDLHGLVETAIFDEEASLAAMQFSENKPDQYQAYDRILAESYLKRGIAAPILGLAVALCLSASDMVWSPLLLVTGIASSLYLSARGHREANEAYRHLLTAMSLGWTTCPTLGSIRAALNRLDETAPSSVPPELIAVEKGTLVVQAMLESLPTGPRRTYVSKLRHPSRSTFWQYASDSQRNKINRMLEAAVNSLNFEAALADDDVEEASRLLADRAKDPG